MQKSFRLVAALALIGLAIWIWRTFFPSPESVIRSRLTKLAKAASFEPGDGIVSRAFNAQSIAGYFTADAIVKLEPRGFPPRTFTGRDELQETALAIARGVTGLRVEFLDINVSLGPDKQTALANLTAKATLAGERDFYVMEMNFKMKKVDGHWLISQVETVKTLMRNRHLGVPGGRLVWQSG